MIDFEKQETVLDAYSGVGTIGLIASKNAKKVISVEINKNAHKNAIENAKRNSIGNLDNIIKVKMIIITPHGELKDY